MASTSSIERIPAAPADGGLILAVYVTPPNEQLWFPKRGGGVDAVHRMFLLGELRGRVEGAVVTMQARLLERLDVVRIVVQDAPPMGTGFRL